MDTQVKYHHLTSHTLFNNLSNEQLMELCAYAKVKIMHKGERIEYGDSDIEKIYFLVKGKLKVHDVNSDGSLTIKEVIQADDVFGSMVSSDSTDTSASELAEVLSYDAVICEFSFAQFEDVIIKNPTLALSFTKKVMAKLKKAEHRYANLVNKDVKSRLTGFFKEWAIKEGSLEGNKMVLTNYLTHNDIAGLINTSRQTVTTLLNELKTSYNIHYTRKQIEIPLTMLN